MTSYPSDAAYPSALGPLDPKVTADNGGDFSALLQPEHQAAFQADLADDAAGAAIAAAVNGLRDVLVSAGLMKAS